MSTIRQDAWSGDDDLILAEVVLRHIREGSTQLAAFEEVGERLSRTSAACGFRWNSTIRKKYESAIALAKKQRATEKKAKPIREAEWSEEIVEEITSPIDELQLSEEDTEQAADPLTMEQVLSFLAKYHENNQNQLTASEVNQLKSENEQLKQQLEAERKRNQVIAEDYRSLLSIMDRARKMSLYDQVTEQHT